MDWSDLMGGGFGYIVSRDGARRLLACVAREGIRHGIDWFLVRPAAPQLHAVSTEPHLISSRLAQPGSRDDSDIQHDFEPLRSPTP